MCAIYSYMPKWSGCNKENMKLRKQRDKELLEIENYYYELTNYSILLKRLIYERKNN